MLHEVVLDVNGPRASARRIAAMVRRYVYLIMGSFPRIVELMYWPLVQMLLWGFLQMHLARSTTLYEQAAGLLIGSVLLWDILLRSQFGFSLSFLEEMWSRNLSNILMSPLRPGEYVLSLMAISIIRLCLALLPVILLANLFFGFNLFSLGIALAAFFANPPADMLRLLPSRDAAGLVAARRPGAPAHPCLRRDARAADRQRVPAGPDADFLRPEHRLFQCGVSDVSLFPLAGAPQGFAHADR
jgi:hypothetical protein